MCKRVFTIVFLLSFLLPDSYSQSIQLNLDDALDLALTNSPDFRIYKKELEGAWWEYQLFKAGRKPGLVLNGNTPGLSRSISNVLQPDGTELFLEQNQAMSNLDLSIFQPIGLTGGTVSLSSGVDRIDVFGTSGYKLWSASPLLINLHQPLFQFNSAKWDRKTKPLDLEVSEARFAESLEELNVEVVQTFFDLVIAESEVKIAELNLRINDSIFNVSQGRYNVGKIAENDLLQAELGKIESSIRVQNNLILLETAREQFKIILGLDDTAKFSLIAETFVPKLEIAEEEAFNRALKNWSMLKDFERRKLNSQMEVERSKFDNNFSGNITASFGLNQTGNSLEAAFTRPQNQQAVTLGFQIPIVDWGKGKANFNIAKAQYEKLSEEIEIQKRELKLELMTNIRNLKILEIQVYLKAKSDTVAQKRYDVAKNRYLIGKNDLTNLRQAQIEKDNARTSYLESLKRFWVAHFTLRKLTHFDYLKGEEIGILFQQHPKLGITPFWRRR